MTQNSISENLYFLSSKLLFLTEFKYIPPVSELQYTLVFCRMNTNHQLVSTPTSISLDFFSGFDFVSLTNSDDKEFWHVTTIDHVLAIHVNKVSLLRKEIVHNWQIFRENQMYFPFCINQGVQ